MKKTEIRPLNPDEARKFLELVKGDRCEALYTVALAIGLRQGEALGLKSEDADLDTGTITVRHALQRVDRKLVLVEPKSDRSRRTIALPEFAVRALRQHRIRQHEDRLLAGSSWKQTAFVFTTTIGTPMDAISLTRRFQRILKAAGVLGHSQISLTLNTYSHVIPSLQRDAAQRMDAALGTADSPQSNLLSSPIAARTIL